MHKYTHKYNIASHIHLSRFLHNKYNELVIADTFRLLALSMISLFVPIFLLSKAGFTLEEVIYMEIGIFIASVFFHYYVLRVLGYWGVKRSLIFSYILNILLYISLFYSAMLIKDLGRMSFLFIIGYLNMMSAVLYWSAHHVYFLKTTDSADGGRKLGISRSIPAFIGVVAPFVGSVLIEGYSFRLTFLFSACLMMIASGVLFFSNDIQAKGELNWLRVVDIRRMRKNIIFFLQGVSHLATGLVWPLFLFYMQVHLISMGLLYLFSNTFYALVSYLGGKQSDTRNAKRVGRVGAIGHGASIIFRALSSTIVFMTTFQTMGGIFGGLLHVVLDSRFFKHSHADFMNAVMNRELYMYLGRIFLAVIFLILLKYFEILPSVIYLLIISGVGTFFLSLCIVDGKNEYQ